MANFNTKPLEFDPPGSDLELAWAAGFFDGEGCTTYEHRRQYPHRVGTVRAQMSQKLPEMLERFRDAVGIGVIRYQESQDKWYWRVSGQNYILHLRELLSPYLGVHKRDQMEAAIASHADARSKSRFVDRRVA